MIFEIIDRWSTHAARRLFCIGVYGALPALLVLICVDVVLRYVFNSPLQWSRDASGLLLLIVLFSALPQAWDEGYHIRMEVIHARMSARWQGVADVVSTAATFVFVALMSIQAVVFSRYMFSTGQTGEDLQLALWPFMAFIAVCGLVFSARLVSNPSSGGAFRRGADRRWI